MIERTSNSRFVLSKLGKDLQHIIILSDHDLPSWVFMLSPFLETLHHLSVTLILPSGRFLNHFKLSRRRNVKIIIRKVPVQRVDTYIAFLSTVLRPSSTLFVDGSLGFLATIFSVLQASKLHHYCAILPGSVRFSKLIKFSSLRWSTIKHHNVGGVTFSSFWIGTCGKFPHSDVSSSFYLSACIGDLLEFAPKSIKVVKYEPAALPSGRTSSVIRAKHDKSTFWKFGLIPISAVHSNATKVVCETPFSSTGYGIRSLSTVEKVRFLDFPVEFERSVKIDSTFDSECLIKATPIKVVHHCMFLMGFYEIQSFAPKNISREVTSPPHQEEGVLVDAENFYESNLESDPFVNSVAVKDDDAAVPVHLWDNYLIKDQNKFQAIARHSPFGWKRALGTMRKLMIALWHRRIQQSFLKYLKFTWGKVAQKYLSNDINLDDCPVDFQKDVVAGLDCITYASKADWWEWIGGSRLFYWRWPLEFRRSARDGIPMFWTSNSRPTARKPQPEVTDSTTHECMKRKVSKVRNLGYVRPNFCKSLIRYFSVPKGTSDIRMVYDGTASGFNDLIWVPNFGLPTVESLLRNTRPGTWMVDLDVGDQFLNFMLHEEAQKFVGIDITPLFKDELNENKRIIWESWCRCAMGLKSSPYQAIRAMLFADEYLKGFPSNEKNPFRYGKVSTNLPGSTSYCPSIPWFTVSRDDSSPATVLATYVDDERIHGDSYDNAWAAAHQVSSRECYLGIQDAARKRRPPSQRAGAWAGTIVRTNSTDVGKTISQDRWMKAKFIVSSLFDSIQSNPRKSLNTKELLSQRGYLIYIVRTYSPMVPYLKGLHLTIDSWRPNRDKAGWKDPNFSSKNLSSESDTVTPQSFHNYPKLVSPVPRLKDDLTALMKMMEADTPPVVITHSKRIYIVRYGFGDASGGGFGSSFTDPVEGIDVMIGTWNELGRAQSSNFREFSNLVLRLESEAENGKLEGAEVFLFTDNSTTESAYHNGTSSSPLLFDLVLRLRILELKFGVRLHVIHVPGTRMIAQGTDGVSRGNQMEGVMGGMDMLKFIPLNSSAIERNENLLFWFRFWLDSPTLSPLSPTEWLWKGQGLSEEIYYNVDGVPLPKPSEEKVFLWTPPPAIADIAIEYIRASIHRRPSNIHIFACPKIMTYKWRRSLFRSCDVYFYLDVEENSVWDEKQFESLLIGIYLPLLPFPPWTFRRSKFVLELERTLSKVQKAKARTKGFILRKFLLQARAIPSMSEGMVRRML